MMSKYRNKKKKLMKMKMRKINKKANDEFYGFNDELFLKGFKVYFNNILKLF